MSTRQTVFVALALLFAITVGLAGVKASQALQAPPTSVAIVDLQRVFENLKEQQQVKADLQARGEELQREREQRRKDLATLQGDLDLLQPGSPAYKAKEAELNKALIDIQVWQQFESQRLQLEERLQVENLIRKTNEAIERVAQDAGYSLVLFTNQPVNLRAGDSQQQINIRMVAYHSDAIDLTDQVIQRMNNEFQAGAQ
jgi:Skp family chaperone for outer membrane proteins